MKIVLIFLFILQEFLFEYRHCNCVEVICTILYIYSACTFYSSKTILQNDFILFTSSNSLNWV